MRGGEAERLELFEVVSADEDGGELVGGEADGSEGLERKPRATQQLRRHLRLFELAKRDLRIVGRLPAREKGRDLFRRETGRDQLVGRAVGRAALGLIGRPPTHATRSAARPLLLLRRIAGAPLLCSLQTLRARAARATAGDLLPRARDATVGGRRRF